MSGMSNNNVECTWRDLMVEGSCAGLSISLQGDLFWVERVDLGCWMCLVRCRYEREERVMEGEKGFG